MIQVFIGKRLVYSGVLMMINCDVTIINVFGNF